MRITAIETLTIAVPFDGGGPPQMFGGKAWTHLETLMVKVRTDSGIIGWGEAFGHVAIPATRAALDHIVGPIFLGRDPSDIVGLTGDVARSIHALGRNGPCIYALSGIEIALWDIAGQVAGLPLYRLFGAGPRDWVEGYASLFRLGDPMLVAANMARARRSGYRRFKLHEVSLEAVRAANDAIADNRDECQLMLDTNCPWSAPQAVAMARLLRGERLAWLEEPVWPPDDAVGLARVRAEGIPIAAGENAQGLSEFLTLLRADAVDVVQPSVTKIGGIAEMRRIVTVAESFGVSIAPHSPYLGPGFLATLHVLASMRDPAPIEALWLDMDAHPFDPWIRARDGRFSIPQAPGLGVVPDPELIARYQVGETTLLS